MVKTAKLPVKQKRKLLLCYNAISEKKGEGTVILDLRGISSVADFFIVCHGSNTRQVAAIADNVEAGLKDGGFKRCRIEGMQQATWVLMDATDIVVHVFDEEVRRFYALEDLWVDAPRIEVGELNDAGAE